MNNLSEFAKEKEELNRLKLEGKNLWSLAVLLLALSMIGALIIGFVLGVF